MRTANTSSAVLIKCSGRGGRQLGLSPAHVHFGAVALGAAARRRVRLMNLGADVARVTIQQPQPPLRSAAGRRAPAGFCPALHSRCMCVLPHASNANASCHCSCTPLLRLLYKPGPIPPGMAMAITLELVPDQAGDFVGEVRAWQPAVQTQ